MLEIGEMLLNNETVEIEYILNSWIAIDKHTDITVLDLVISPIMRVARFTSSL